MKVAFVTDGDPFDVPGRCSIFMVPYAKQALTTRLLEPTDIFFDGIGDRLL